MKPFFKKIRFILINLLAAIVLAWIIGYIVLRKLDTYTQHGYSIAVPDFSGLHPAEAIKLGEYHNLRVEITDSIYDKSAAPGTVVEQYPVVGSGVKENRKIFLTINANNAEKVAFPNLKNSAYRQTIQTLQTKGFKIGKIEYVDSEFKNLVIELRHQEEVVHPGTLLPKGAEIDIVLGSGRGSNAVFVPNLIGKTLWEATNAIRYGYLNMGEVIPDNSIATGVDKNFAIIYRQIPGPNASVRAGSIVELHITVDKTKITSFDSLIETE